MLEAGLGVSPSFRMDRLGLPRGGRERENYRGCRSPLGPRLEIAAPAELTGDSATLTQAAALLSGGGVD
jgi:hypothetical protein